MARRKAAAVQLVDTSAVKMLNPRDPDTKYMGDEPLFLAQPENRLAALIRSFNWYNHFYTKKDAKGLLIQYLDLTGSQAAAKTLSKVEENKVNMSLVFLARMSLRGLKLTDEEKDRLKEQVDYLVSTVEKPEAEKKSNTSKKAEKKESNRPNVQEIMKEKAREAAGEIEGMFDDFIKAGAKANYNARPIDELAKKNVLPQHIHILNDVWKKKRDEFEELQLGKDAQLVQAYSYLSKTQVKNIIKFIDQFLGDFASYVNVKKASKAPRRRKAVPVEKLVARLKYCKEFKDSATKLELVSLHPVKVHGASECYLYDTKKRKLVYLVADEYNKTLTVKGTTILGFDTNKSQSKTVRKPETQLKEFVKLGKPAGRKFFTDIRAVGVTPNGRTNDSMVILKAW